MDNFELSIELEFCAAHILKGHKGKCSNLHGHNYKVEVCISGNKLNEIGILLDFADIKESVNKVIEKLDHKYLNEIDYKPFIEGKTSAEYIAKYIYDNLSKDFNTSNYKVHFVKVHETSKYSVKYSKS
ncbi:MAG: 6-carboxy-5,6,7,8-tetrahydropterin synthase [Candidatus Sericytochromatia bacterium]|nr:MAG: 6-carboxy-5,6,7,8-tetrahydropterin synthase [Candidatus Sericytochromatia bacterium]